MSVEDRLLLLLAQVRETGGDAALQDMSALRSRLSSRAPDLHGEIQALTAALSKGVPARIAMARDPSAERAAAANEIAQQERLSIAVVTPAVDVACRSGIHVTPPLKAREPDEWAGDSMIVGAAPPPAPAPAPASGPAAGGGFAPAAPPFQPQAPAPAQGAPQPFGGHQGFGAAAAPHGFGAPHHAPPPRDHDGYDHGGGYGQQAQPFYTKVWFFMLIGALIVGGAIVYTQWNSIFGRGQVARVDTPSTPAPAPGPNNPQPAPSPAPQPAGPASAETLFTPGGPLLAEEANAPPLVMQQAADGRRGVTFSMTAPNGQIDAVLVLPAGGWTGPATIVATGSGGLRSVGTGTFELSASDRPVRLMRVQWTQDGLGAGSAAIAIVGEPGQTDVPFSNATLCVMDGTDGDAVGCGQIQ